MRAEQLSTSQLAGLCDHTFLTPAEAFRKEAKNGESSVHLRRRAFERFLNETHASALLPYAVCVRTSDVAHARAALPAGIVIAATVGFPDGPHHSTAYKIAEAAVALGEGATEIDMVLDYDALKKQQLDRVHRDIEAVAKSVHARGGVLKVILEICELTLDETRTACLIVDQCGAGFVKTSTGFGSHGATVEHLKVMRATFSRGIKISGGVQPHNLYDLLLAGSHPGEPLLADPMALRIGESTLLAQLSNGELS